MDNITTCEIINAHLRGYDKAAIAEATGATHAQIDEVLLAHPELLKIDEEGH